MIKNVAGYYHASLSPDLLLTNGEIVVIVDDDPAIREPLKMYLSDQGLAVEDTSNATDLKQVLSSRKVALVLLDIGLPDTDGVTLIPELVKEYPDMAIVMLTGVADLQTALDCIRKGADDYLSKPSKFHEILFVVKKTLEKRRLIFENRKYQEDLEKAHFRIQLMHQLSLNMNSVYLSTVELDEILRAILVGITANEGLRFNRAFLVMFDEKNQVLEGRMAIGSTCREAASRIWHELEEKGFNFLDLVKNIRESECQNDSEVNNVIKNIRVPITDTDHILIKSALERRSIRVSEENGCAPILLERRNIWVNAQNGDTLPEHLDRRDNNGSSGLRLEVPHGLIELLNEANFVVVPLYSPGRSFGVIIADNFITRNPITDSHISALELFASQASLAIEHSHLYMDMQAKIHEQEELYHELDKNKDLLVDAERYSALGQMSAQMVHVIRNPITSIGGVARILAKKVKDKEWEKYLTVMIKETARLESTLEDLFDFVTQSQLRKEQVSLYNLIRKTLMLVQKNLTDQNIVVEQDFHELEPALFADPRQMRQMFLHIFKNAIEAMPSGGTLGLLVHVEGDWIQITITDTGVGMADAHLDKAKDSFFTTKTYGTGMGLTMVERVLTAHGGHFELEKKEVGMKVKIHLPAACKDETQQEK